MAYRTNPVSDSIAYALNSPTALSGFHPGSAPITWRENPWKAETRTGKEKPPVVLSFLMGLTSGIGRHQTWKPEAVRRDLMKWFPEGGTIVAQYGWFAGARENSVRVLIENTGTGFSKEKFVERAVDMVNTLAKKYRQKEIWYDFFEGSKRVGRPMKSVYYK